ncbi:hypothetical protein [Pseudogemmobacter sonorensis]|uniref:hypothetical protein n=1 Tax=Pseudogemmobacter sonorensis TaxID=2989681 RepID=UPI0036C81DE7
MGHLSQHNLWGPGDNRVVALPPSPGDLFVVTTVGGKLALVHPIDEYDKAVSLANAFIHRWRGRPVATIKVLSLTLQEAQAMGYLPANLSQNQTPEQRAEARQFVVSNLWRIIRDSNDAKPRAEALDLLRSMGELK